MATFQEFDGELDEPAAKAGFTPFEGELDSAPAPKPRTLKQNLVGDDPIGEIGKAIGRLPKDAAALGDMILSLPGQLVGVGADAGMRAVALGYGIDHRTAGIMAQKFRHDIADPLSNPIEKLMHAFGYDQGYNDAAVAQAMNKVGTWMEKGGNYVEKQTGGMVTKEDVDSLGNTALAALGGRGTAAALQKRIDAKGRLTQEQLPELTEKQRAENPVEVPRAEKPAINAEAINEALGIKPQNVRAAENKARRGEIWKTVAEDPDLADYYAAKAEERVRQGELVKAEHGVAEEKFPAAKEDLPDMAPDVMIADALGNIAKTPQELAILRSPGTQEAIRRFAKGQRGAIDADAAAKFIADLGFEKPKEVVAAFLAGLDEARAKPRGLPEGLKMEELTDGTGFKVVNAAGKEVGSLRDNLKRGQAEQIGEPASVDMVKVDPSLRGQGVGSALYDAFAAKHEGRIAPSGKTEPAAWRLWKEKFPAKVDQFVQQEAARLTDGASAELVLGNIKDAEIRSRVARAASEAEAGQSDFVADAAQTISKSSIPGAFLSAIKDPYFARQVLDKLEELEPGTNWQATFKHAKANTGKGMTVQEYTASQRFVASLNKQSGKIDAAMAAKLAAVAGAAVIGSNLADDPLFGGLTGAAFTAAGLWGAGKEARKIGAEIARGADYAGGLASTRIGNMSQAVLHRARGYEQGVLERTHHDLTEAHPFIEQLSKVKGEKGQELARAILSNEPEAIRAAIAATGDSKLAVGWNQVRALLDKVGAELQTHGRIGTLRENYFPRMVKDLDGLMASFGAEVRTPLQKALNDANVKSLRETGSGLSDLEQTIIINRQLASMGSAARGKPGFSKKRQIDTITKELQPFYATPVESLHSYLSLAAKDLEKAKFFGRDLQKTGGKVDVQASIGNVVRRELDAGNITAGQAEELGSILRSRFGPGEQSSAGLIQDAKNYINAGLLGNVVSAATQLGDVGTSVAIQGLRPTLEGVVRQLTRNNRVNMKDFGLADHISEEFTSTRKSAKFLNAAFKLGLFTAVDRFGKNVTLEAALSKLQSQVKTIGGQQVLARKYADAFGEDYQTLVAELRSGKMGDQTRAALFSELSDLQPITRLEVPQAYLDMPNGRAIYMLKTFMLKQFDIVRREGYNEIKAGRVAAGIKNLTRYAIALGVAGATTDWLRDWMMGREVDPDVGDLTSNIFKTFGWSQYVIDQAKKGEPFKAVGGTIAPPFKMFDDLAKASGGFEMSEAAQTKARERAVQYLPVIGKLVESHFLGGAERTDKTRAKLKAKEGK